MPKVNLYATFRDLTGKSQLELPGATVGEVLENLVRAYPALKEELFEGEGLATLDLFPPVAGGGFERTFGAFPPWLLERYLEEWGGTREGEGVYRLPGAVVRFREVEPLKVGSLSIPQLLVEVEGEAGEAWFERIALAASRGGG